MGSPFLATEDLEVAAARLAGLVRDASSLVVWVSILDGQDQFARAEHPNLDHILDKERLYQQLNHWVVVEAFHGRIVPDPHQLVYRDAVIATFAQRQDPRPKAGAPGALEHALAAALALREECARWNCLHAWKKCPPAGATWQYQIHPRVGIAPAGEWLTALGLAAQARRGEVLLPRDVWKKMSERDKFFLHPLVSGVRSGCPYAEWQAGWQAAQGFLAADPNEGQPDVQGKGDIREFLERSGALLGSAAPVRSGQTV
jgi:hypothetical protein